MSSKQRVHVTVEGNTHVFCSPSGSIKTFASDFAVHLALSARAWNVYPWQVLGKTCHKIEENEKTEENKSKKQKEAVKHH